MKRKGEMEEKSKEKYDPSLKITSLFSVFFF